MSLGHGHEADLVVADPEDHGDAADGEDDPLEDLQALLLGHDLGLEHVEAGVVDLEGLVGPEDREEAVADVVQVVQVEVALQLYIVLKVCAQV